MHALRSSAELLRQVNGSSFLATADGERMQAEGEEKGRMREKSGSLFCLCRNPGRDLERGPARQLRLGAEGKARMRIMEAP